jgi:hypothetical protein
MTTADRLNAVSARLKARGVVDAKLTFDPEVVLASKDAVKNSVVLMLEQYLDGEYAPLTFSDKHLVEQQNTARH